MPTALAPASVGATDAMAELFAVLGQYLAVIDPDLQTAIMATAVSVGEDDMDPLWLMPIGPSSGSKSESIATVTGVADESVSDLTLAGLLSQRAGTAKKAAPAPKGILPRLGDGCDALLTISDFGSVLARAGGRRSGGEQTGIFEALRDIYDGRYSRSMEGVNPQWVGRLTIIAGVTPAIDEMRAYNNALGTRFVSFRLGALDQDQRTHVAEHVSSRAELDQHRAEARDLTGQIVLAGREQLKHAVVSEETRKLVCLCASLTGYGRVNLPRNYRQEVCGIAHWEEPGRLTGQLMLLAKSLTALGVGDEVVQRVIRRAAQSTVPADMLAVLRETGEPLVTAQIAKRAGMDRKVAVHALEAWAATGVIGEERVTDDNHREPVDDEPDYRTRKWVWGERHRREVEGVLGVCWEPPATPSQNGKPEATETEVQRLIRLYG